MNRIEEFRVKSADISLRSFAALANMKIEHEPEAVAIDLVANILHWCDSNSIDTSEVLRLAQDHHADETSNA